MPNSPFFLDVPAIAFRPHSHLVSVVTSSSNSSFSSGNPRAAQPSCRPTASFILRKRCMPTANLLCAPNTSRDYCAYFASSPMPPRALPIHASSCAERSFIQLAPPSTRRPLGPARPFANATVDPCSSGQRRRYAPHTHCGTHHEHFRQRIAQNSRKRKRREGHAGVELNMSQSPQNPLV